MIPFYLTHLDSLGQFSDNALSILNKNDNIVKFITRCGMYFPDEILDINMTSLTKEACIDYCTILNYEKEGDLPDDLTQTELILTKVLHGEIHKDYAKLLVCALENMEMYAVDEQMRKIFKG